MKHYSAIELIMIIFSSAVCIVIVTGVFGMIFQADKTTIEGKVALMDLLKYITGGVFGAIGAIMSRKKEGD